MKYHKNNILLSSKCLLQSLKLNFQKNLNSHFSILKKSIPQFFSPHYFYQTKDFFFSTHSFFQKIDKHKNENYDQCDPDSNPIPRYHSNSYIRTTCKNERGMQRNRQRCTTVFLGRLMRPLTYS